ILQKTRDRSTRGSIAAPIAAIGSRKPFATTILISIGPSIRQRVRFAVGKRLRVKPTRRVASARCGGTVSAKSNRAQLRELVAAEVVLLDFAAERVLDELPPALGAKIESHLLVDVVADVVVGDVVHAFENFVQVLQVVAI